MKMLLALTVALVPGVAAWWQGRRLLASLDSPALAELWWRRRQRQIQLAAVCTVVVAMIGGVHAVWLVALLIVAALAGAFPARRAVLDESWSFGGYLVWLVRLVAALGSFWVLVIVGPSLVAWAGPDRPWAAIAVGVALAIRLVLPHRRFLALLGAVPMDAAEIEGLDRFLTNLPAVSSSPPPRLLRLDIGGGRWVNALAVPHPTEPAVVFTQPLLDLLPPDEVIAVLAHEVAHLEHHGPRRLRWQAVGATVLAAAAVGLVPLSRLVTDQSVWVCVGWLVFLLLVFTRKLARNRDHEADSDWRAIELGVDAEALISALRTLHMANRVPRRLSREDEDRSTHPSLARRIQAIRRMAAVEAEISGQPTGQTASEKGVVCAGAREGEWVIFDDNRITWLEGVAAEAATDPDDMRAAASATRSLVYRGLTELRIHPRSGRHAELVAVSVDGERLVTPLASDAVGTTQKALDAVDTEIAGPPSLTLLGKIAQAQKPVRLIAAFSVVLALSLPAAGAAAISSLIALIRPRAPWLLAAGTGCLTAVLCSLPRLSGSGELVRLQQPGVAVVALAGVSFIVVGAARARRWRDERESQGVLPALILGVLLSLVWTGVLAFAWLNGDTGIDTYWLHRAVRWAPSLVAFPLAIAAALALAKRRRQWWEAVGAMALAGLALWIGGGIFRDALVSDPLLPSVRPPEVAIVPVEKLLEIELGEGGFSLRLSPDGSLAAVGRRPSDAGYDPARPAATEWRMWRLNPPEGTELAVIEAVDLALLGGGHAMVLMYEDAPQPETDILFVHPLKLSRIALGRGNDPIWSASIAGALQPELGIDSDSARWRVEGRDHGPDGGWGWFACEASLESPEFVERRWRVDPEISADWVVFAGETALATAVQFDDRLEASPLMWLGARTWQELLLVEGDNVAQLARTRLQVSCSEIDSDAAICAAGDAEGTFLWRVAPVDGGDTPLEPVGWIPEGGLFIGEAFDGGALWWSPQHDDVTIVDRRSPSPVRLQIEGEGWRTAIAASGSGVVAEIRVDENGSRLVVYRAS